MTFVNSNNCSGTARLPMVIQKKSRKTLFGYNFMPIVIREYGAAVFNHFFVHLVALFHRLLHKMCQK
uniref:Uncharacterized protein n=1 Tax=Anguilla anguilla TaxID=7936 RepID=A0A0E9XHT1_ANGAN